MFTDQDNDGMHATITQRLPVGVESGKVDVIHCEVFPLIHVVNVRNLHILRNQGQKLQEFCAQLCKTQLLPFAMIRFQLIS